MSSEAHSISLIAPVVLLAAAVIAVPIFKRIGLGRFGLLNCRLDHWTIWLCFFHDSASILHIAELVLSCTCL
jgi:glutathione-regulated potassium-efflux system protein KefB